MRCLLPSYPSCDPSLSPLSLATTLSIFPSFSLIVLPTCIPCPAPLQILGHARPRHQTRLLHLRQLPRVPHRPGTIIVLVLLISMLAPCAFISANSCHAKTTKFTTITTIFSIADLTLSLSLFLSHILSLLLPQYITGGKPALRAAFSRQQCTFRVPCLQLFQGKAYSVFHCPFL